MDLKDAQPTCGSCRFWRRDDEQVDVGECRRMPPMVVSDSDGDPYTAWPYTDEIDLACGEHKPRN